MVLRAESFGAPFGNESSYIETTYDFSSDGGAKATFVMTGAAAEDCMVKLLAIKCETAMASTGNATLSVGTSASGTAFITTEAKTSFALAAVVTPESATTGIEGFVKVAAGATLDCAIGTEVITTGKFHFVWEIRKY